MKGRFVSEEELAQIPHASAQGVFLKDPTLKDFLKSGPARLVTIKMVHGFALRNRNTGCFKIIDDYATGGDGGLTRQCMRLACGMSATAPDKAPPDKTPPARRPRSSPAAAADLDVTSLRGRAY